MADKRKGDDKVAPGMTKVEATAQFHRDGVNVRRGETLVMTTHDADELVALNFVRPYGRRDMRAR